MIAQLAQRSARRRQTPAAPARSLTAADGLVRSWPTKSESKSAIAGVRNHLAIGTA